MLVWYKSYACLKIATGGNSNSVMQAQTAPEVLRHVTGSLPSTWNVFLQGTPKFRTEFFCLVRNVCIRSCYPPGVFIDDDRAKMGMVMTPSIVEISEERKTLLSATLSGWHEQSRSSGRIRRTHRRCFGAWRKWAIEQVAERRLICAAIAARKHTRARMSLDIWWYRVAESLPLNAYAIHCLTAPSVRVRLLSAAYCLMRKGSHFAAVSAWKEVRSLILALDKFDLNVLAWK